MESAVKIVSIAIGGSLGAVARHVLNISPLADVGGKFPLPTFLINLTGSFLIGLLFILFSERIEVSDNVRSAVIIGFLGAFTTFATFEMEIFTLMRDRQFLIAFVYLFLSVFVGFLGVMAGVALGRRI